MRWFGSWVGNLWALALSSLFSRGRFAHTVRARYSWRMKSEELIDPTEVARILGVSPRTLEAMRRENRGPAYVKVSPKCLRYHPSDLARFLTQKRIEPEPFE